jgi:hypothetical protein
MRDIVINHEESYQLTLTHDEAVSLVTVLSFVLGDLDLSRRKHTDQILKALIEVGVIPNFREIQGWGEYTGLGQPLGLITFANR